MCPLRLILIFLSATLAGILLLKNLMPNPEEVSVESVDHSVDMPMQCPISSSSSSSSTKNRFSKVRSVIEVGFWTLVEMASGRYLWKNLVSPSSKLST